jgi:hypothetical protein
MKRAMKFLHTAGAIGVTGGLACYLILLGTAPEPLSAAEYAVLRRGIAAVCEWLLLPSLLAVLTSGLLAMAIHRPFLGARWAWTKAVLGLAMFEGTLGSVQAPAERGAALSARAAAGELDAGALAAMIGDEWNALWFILGLAVANVALAIWRPGLRRRGATSA